MDEFLQSMQNKTLISQAPMFDNLYIEPSLGIQTGVGAGYPDAVRPLQEEDYEQIPPEITKKIASKTKKKKRKGGTKSTTKKRKTSKKTKKGAGKIKKRTKKKTIGGKSKKKLTKKNVGKKFKKLKKTVL